MILVINCGSTSIKYELFDDLESIIEGKIGNIDQPDSYVKHTVDDKTVTENRSIENHKEGMGVVLEYITQTEKGRIDDTAEVTAVGHRVVHGGDITEPRIIDSSTKETIREFASIAPLHNPVNLRGIEAMETHLPDTPQVAVFDTAFHQTMPPEAYLYALPYQYYEEKNIRRYGFHGISHAYVAQQACEFLDQPIDKTNIITCHLGGGCSITAVEQGRSVDTSMGFSPLEGVVMATRTGDIDPTIVKFLVENHGMDREEVFEILNNKSGLAGLSGISGDMRELLDARKNGDDQADLAIRTFAYSIKQQIGAYAATLETVDALIFTAGIGENTPLVRKLAGDIPLLGTEIDPGKNEMITSEPGIISTDESAVDVLVVPTNEELRIAKQTKDLVDSL